MIKALNNSQFVSRIFTDINGRQFCLNFFVTVVNGEVRGHLISAQPISSSTVLLTGKVSDGSICLPIVCDNKKPATVYAPDFVPVVSPYFSLEFLINSQPTRAPSQN
jgi:hypothetical protein